MFYKRTIIKNEKIFDFNLKWKVYNKFEKDLSQPFSLN
jgi:hypothetical protein